MFFCKQVNKRVCNCQEVWAQKTSFGRKAKKLHPIPPTDRNLLCISTVRNFQAFLHVWFSADKYERESNHVDNSFFIFCLIQNCLVPSLLHSYKRTKSASPSSPRLFCCLLVSISWIFTFQWKTMNFRQETTGNFLTILDHFLNYSTNSASLV